MQNGGSQDKCFYPTLTLMIDSYIASLLIFTISGGFRGGAMGASAPPAESMIKKILTYLFSSQCTVGTFCVFCKPGLEVSTLKIKSAVNCHT